MLLRIATAVLVCNLCWIAVSFAASWHVIVSETLYTSVVFHV